jgi:hypothetical protein
MPPTPLPRDKHKYAGRSSPGFEKDAAMMLSHWFARQRGVVLPWGLLIAVACLAPVPAPAQSIQDQPIPSTQTGGHRMLPTLPDDNTPSLSPKQKLNIMQSNFARSKTDAAELAALAKGLREELDKPNVNVLSLEVINRAEKIEKLAKKIREETKGF